MKNVLLIDGSPLFRDFLKGKFDAESVSLDTATGSRDAYTKIITSLPDLIIIETENGIDFTVQELLEKKADDPNAYRIPVIISGPVIERNRVANLARFNVVKYFTKPIKFDVFFEAVSKILGASFFIDTTPCVLDIHLNGNIIMVEIARGLNREKISILKFKLKEILDTTNIRNPKIVLMLTGVNLTFLDVTNVELLFDSLLESKRITQKNIKVLSFDSFVQELVDGREEYFGIQVVQNLHEVLNSLIDSHGAVSSIDELVTDKILEAGTELDPSEMGIKFNSDSENGGKDDGTVIKVAIVDDDVVVRKLLQDTFSQISAETFLFETGLSFLQSVNAKAEYDLVILDIFVPDMDGLSILSSLQRQNFRAPIIVYSQATQREYVIQSLTLGAKSYLVKPQKPSVILQKSVEVLNGQFRY